MVAETVVLVENQYLDRRWKLVIKFTILTILCAGIARSLSSVPTTPLPLIDDLEGRYLVGKDGHLYCEDDYNDLMAKRCKTCDAVIKGKLAKTSIGYFFHPEHFICMKVPNRFSESNMLVWNKFVGQEI
jgi:hypothetical protein